MVLVGKKTTSQPVVDDMVRTRVWLHIRNMKGTMAGVRQIFVVTLNPVSHYLRQISRKHFLPILGYAIFSSISGFHWLRLPDSMRFTKNTTDPQIRTAYEQQSTVLKVGKRHRQHCPVIQTKNGISVSDRSRIYCSESGIVTQRVRGSGGWCGDLWYYWQGSISLVRDLFCGVSVPDGGRIMVSYRFRSVPATREPLLSPGGTRSWLRVPLQTF